MNIVDIILAVILLYGIIRGFFRGFFAEFASLVGFIAGIYGAIHFSHFLSDYLANKVTWNLHLLNLVAFAVTFILIAFSISLAGKFLTKIVNFAALGILNKLIGAAFGFIKIAFIVSVILMFFRATNEDVTLVEQEVLDESILYLPVRTLAPSLIPSIIREVEELEFTEEDVDLI